MRILLVDDCRSEAFYLSSIFNKEISSNYMGSAVQLDTTSDIDTALEYLKTNKPDVILLDLCIPGVDEFEGFFRIQKAYPDIPIVVYTGRNDPRLESQTLKLGADDYIEKGALTGHRLLRALERAQKTHECRARMKELENAIK